MRTWLPLTLSQTNSTANGTIRSSREKTKRVSQDSAEVVQVILRRALILLGMFAVAGVTLSAIGIYGVMSYGIAQRTHEFGIRMALGAGRADILRLILGVGMRLTCIGAVLGFAGSLVLTQLLSTLLYGVRPNDPLTF